MRAAKRRLHSSLVNRNGTVYVLTALMIFLGLHSSLVNRNTRGHSFKVLIGDSLHSSLVNRNKKGTITKVIATGLHSSLVNRNAANPPRGTCTITGFTFLSGK